MQIIHYTYNTEKYIKKSIPFYLRSERAEKDTIMKLEFLSKE